MCTLHLRADVERTNLKGPALGCMTWAEERRHCFFLLKNLRRLECFDKPCCWQLHPHQHRLHLASASLGRCPAADTCPGALAVARQNCLGTCITHWVSPCRLKSQWEKAIENQVWVNNWKVRIRMALHCSWSHCLAACSAHDRHHNWERFQHSRTHHVTISPVLRENTDLVDGHSIP